VNTKFDLIILGAGPAGISTALHLIQLDQSWKERVLVLEKKAHPRPKICGGGVTRLGINLLRELGLEWPLPIPQAWVDDACLIYQNRTIHVRAQPELVIFERSEFDNYLANQARWQGIQIHENEPAISFSIDQDGVIINTASDSYRAKVLVAADGSNSLVRKTITSQEKRTRLARTLHLVTPIVEFSGPPDHTTAIFDFTPTLDHLQGYYWRFPSFSSSIPALNQGVYDGRIARSRPLAALINILNTSLSKYQINVAERKDLASCPIHHFSPRNTFSRPHLLLVGDAAGSDPVFGEGIGSALAYGKIAALAIKQAFDTNNFSFANYRSMILTSPLGHYLMLRWAIAWWGYRLSGFTWFMHLVWMVGGMIARFWRPPAPIPGWKAKSDQG